MSANPQRRRLLGLFAAAPIAAAAGVRPTSTLGRAGAMSLSVRADDRFSAVLGRLAGQLQDTALPAAGEDLTELALGLDIMPRAVTPSGLLRWAQLGSPATSSASEARAIAALALAYPPEIAAYRSFGAPMRRRLYAELLTRESERMAAAGAPSAQEDAP